MTRREELAQISREFDEAAPYLQAAIEYDRSRGYDLSDIKDRVMLGDLQLWRGDDWAAVTEVLNYPRRRTVLIHLAGGKLTSMVQANDDLEEFARVMGADYIEIIGRKGWARRLRDMGYEEAAVHLVKEVPHERQ